MPANEAASARIGVHFRQTVVDMAMEIERKFLVVGQDWRADVATSTPIMQGYLASTGRVTVRVRVRGEVGYLTVKGATTGVSRSEFEFEIPVEDARTMLSTLADGPVIEKVRHLIPVAGHTWELDVFGGDNDGLVMAELELSDPEEEFAVPAWAGEEVSDDPRYFNVNLAAQPWRTWAENV